MSVVYKTDMDILKKTADLLERKKSTFCSDDQKTVDAFCDLCEKLEQRSEAEKERNRKRMHKFRTDPKTAEKAREQSRKDTANFRKRKKESEAE